MASVAKTCAQLAAAGRRLSVAGLEVGVEVETCGTSGAVDATGETVDVRATVVTVGVDALVGCRPAHRLYARRTGMNRWQSQTADFAPGAATCGVTLSTRHFRVAIYTGTLCANMMSCASEVTTLWRYTNLFIIIIIIMNIQHANCGPVSPDHTAPEK